MALIAPERAAPAPAWETDGWLNHDGALRLDELRGRVVVLHAFQMLCPGCVAHGLPQAQRIADAFPREDVAVIGLHTVFEHHDAMRPVSLRAFLHEYRVGYPVGIDAPGDGTPIPRTMAAYALRGTPTLILIDRDGRRRLDAFGRLDDLRVGAAIATLVEERAGAVGRGRGRPAEQARERGCDADGCRV